MSSLKRGKNLHFEVHGQANNRWNLIEIFDEQPEAAALARKLFDSGNYQAVRMLREKFDRDSNEFDSFELLFLGRKRRASKYDEDDLAIPCRSPSDLYSSEGRKAITRLLASVLESWELTATEILYNLDNYARLQASGTQILNAVQRVSIAQSRETGEPVTERMRHLFALIDTAAGQLRKKLAAGVPSLRDMRFIDVIDQVKDREDHRLLLAASIAAELGTLKGTPAKFERLMSFMRFDHPAWVMKTLDMFLSEQLAHRRLLKSLFDVTDLVALLESIARLSRGALGERATNEHLSLLDGFLKARHLSQCRAVLVGHISHELAVNRRLTDLDLLGEFKAIARLGNGIGEAIDADLPDRPLLELLDERFGRLLNPQTLGEFLAAGRNPAEKVQKLIDLERFVVGPSNRRLLANYIVPLLSDPVNEAFWLEPMGAGHAARMKLVTRLQKRVHVSGFQSLHKSRIAGQLDRLGAQLLVRSKILQRLKKSDASAAHKGQKLLIMLAEGYFTDGEARDAAEADMRQYMNEPAFLAPVVEAKSRTEREKAVIRLKKLLADAGIAAPGAL